MCEMVPLGSNGLTIGSSCRKTVSYAIVGSFTQGTFFVTCLAVFEVAYPDHKAKERGILFPNKFLDKYLFPDICP